MLGLDSGLVQPGVDVCVCRRRGLAFEPLPMRDGLSHYRYLVRESVPDVVVARDLGSPPPFIEDVAEHIRLALQHPERLRRFRLPLAIMKLLTGASGTGKSYAIRALWRQTYEMMSGMTGVPLEELPPRVLQLRTAEVLSKYLGESDKQIDRFFQEAEQLACEKFRTPDGREVQLPVIVIAEECDALCAAAAAMPTPFTTASRPRCWNGSTSPAGR